jgi:hypothetical protein
MYAIGDIHGCCEELIGLLQREGFMGSKLEWTGQKKHLWFLGDYTDRGPDGVGVLELIIQLQKEAEAAGGKVQALLGNHDVMLLAAWLFPNAPVPGFGQDREVTFRDLWLMAGGQMQDMRRFTDVHAAWLLQLPVLAIANQTLLMHADSVFYLQCGSDIKSINTTISTILSSDNTRAWDRLAEMFATRYAFIENPPSQILRQLGAKRLIHGHTPAYLMLDRLPEEVTEALTYNNGLCVNVDHCLWDGGPGFVYEF